MKRYVRASCIVLMGAGLSMTLGGCPLLCDLLNCPCNVNNENGNANANVNNANVNVNNANENIVNVNDNVVENINQNDNFVDNVNDNIVDNFNDNAFDNLNDNIDGNVNFNDNVDDNERQSASATDAYALWHASALRATAVLAHAIARSSPVVTQPGGLWPSRLPDSLCISPITNSNALNSFSQSRDNQSDDYNYPDYAFGPSMETRYEKQSVPRRDCADLCGRPGGIDRLSRRDNRRCRDGKHRDCGRDG